MREITLSDGKTYAIYPLTRKQMRAMADLGVSVRGIQPAAGQFDATFDAVLSTQADLAVIDDLPFPDQQQLFLAVVAETWGSEAEEKNSSGSGPKDQTRNA